MTVADFVDPKQIIEQHLCPDKSMVAADFGCGSGGWAIPMAKALQEGKVYAIDLLDEPLSALKREIRAKNIFNIEVVKSDVEKTIHRLLGACADIVLMTNLLFQVQRKQTVLEEAKRILRPGGRLLIIDWVGGHGFGPEEKIDPEEIKTLAFSLGFLLDDEFTAGSHHFGLIFVKPKD